MRLQHGAVQGLDENGPGEGLTEKVHILAGVTPMKSVGMAKYMANRVAGMDVPESLIKRMGSVPKEKAPEEGIAICLETIAELRDIPGVHGIHLMAIEWEEVISQIVSEAGLLPRP
jgi:methylenetetrahydrofolate reductase (NADPH)